VGWPQAGLGGRGCQKLDDAASRAHGGAVQVEGWGGCQEGRGSEPGEGQQSGGQPEGELGLLNLDGGGPAGGGGGGSGCGSAGDGVESH
jgi:hypothetical protein